MFGLTLAIYDNYSDPDASIATLMFDKMANLSVDWSETENVSDDSVSKILRFRWKVRCANHYYGANCQTHCVPSDDSFGHYNCSSNGTKMCLPGYTATHLNCSTGTDINCKCLL